VRAQQEAIAAPTRQLDGGRGMAYGMRMATELVAAIIVGGLIGYGLDRGSDDALAVPAVLHIGVRGRRPSAC